MLASFLLARWWVVGVVLAGWLRRAVVMLIVSSVSFTLAGQWVVVVVLGVVMLIGKSPCVIVYFPRPPPLLGVRSLAIGRVLVCCSVHRISFSTSTTHPLTVVFWR